MTDIEIAQAIEFETHTLTWAEATTELRVLVIQRCIANLTGEPVEATKKVVKVRKPRKAKTAPLTQHATAFGDNQAKGGE